MLRRFAFVVAFLLLLSACSSSLLSETTTSGSEPTGPDVTDSADPKNPAEDDSGTVQVELGVPFRLTVGQSGEIQGVDTDITFTHVTSESRCPSDVQCIWAGQVAIAIEVKQGGKTLGEFELVLGSLIEEDESPSLEIDGLIFLLIDVSPYPQSTQTIEQEDYRAELVVSMLEGPP
ncbi:MAG: hypothetical protein FVQ83_02885 [Chloroflexi bacterium]|nr:hypothetical protein [Chloroflexota bacterium]